MSQCLDYIKNLYPDQQHRIPNNFHVTDAEVVRSFLKSRNRFSHKGDYGTGGLVAGSKGMMGAAALCARAFMRSGAGKLICHIPAVGYTVMQVSVPEAMAKIEPGEDHVESLSSLEKYDAIGIGPGLGSYSSHRKLLLELFSSFEKPIVLDADALNTIAADTSLLKKIPPGSILTPHAREFERIFGKMQTDLDRIHTALKNAAVYNIHIVVKGAFTLVATPGGAAYFNTTGNPGMATGGTGDVLTGILTGLLAQGYVPHHAAMLGVYLHGLAGDLAAQEMSLEALIAGDIIDYLGSAFQTLYNGER